MIENNGNGWYARSTGVYEKDIPGAGCRWFPTRAQAEAYQAEAEAALEDESGDEPVSA